MKKEELRAKRAAIRKEIKERMQQDLEDRKEEIKRRIKREDLSVGEKREKYRRESHEEKIRLMGLAKQEFAARRRMLGEAGEEDEYEEFDAVGGIGEDGSDDFRQRVARSLDPDPARDDEEDMLMADDDDILQPIDAVDPKDVFIMEDDTEDREILRRLQSPIGEHDALPPEAERFAAGPGLEAGEVEVPNLFHYIYNLIFHPIATLDEFDEYIAFPSGLRNVAIFYLLSIVPMVIFAYMAQTVGIEIAEEMAGDFAGTSLAPEPNVLVIYGGTVLSLFLYSLSIAAVNYLFTSEANFITLVTYFAFVNGVSSVVAYVMVIAVALAALIFPPLGLLIIPVLVVLPIWGFALRIIVLMSTYGYGFIAAFLLNMAVWIAVFIAGMFVGPSFQ